ncbi:MAG: hypothetical protein PHN55_14755 [Dysgonamonadaceae bacterium]|nr:hypothetical protein [Dysgonamonadaceae bacterium]
MKILLFLTLVLQLVFPEMEKQQYKEAYSYINNCENLKELDKKICKEKNSMQFPVNVIKEVYPLSVLIFGNEIIENDIMSDVGAKNNKINDFVTEFDKENKFEPVDNEMFEKLFSNNPKSQLYVAFSKPIGNMLFAEIAYNLNPNVEIKSIKDLTTFNKTLALLFVFDENGKIKKVKKHINQYN